MTAVSRDHNYLKINSGGKMQLAICSSGSSNLHLWRQKSNCSSHFVTQFTDALFGVIHTRTLLENLLSENVIVTHTYILLTPQVHQVESGICNERN